MHGSVLAAKIRVPKPQPGLIPRPALVTRLGECLSRPLVLVSAPAGFGKTSLAAEYAAALAAGSPRIAWVSIDPEDDDPVRFWSNAAASFDRAAAGLAGDSPFQAIAEAAKSIQPPGALELCSVLAEAISSLGESFLLVLDDFHRLSADTIMASFARFIERLPECLRVLLLSRGDPPLPLARFRARGLMSEIRVEELRFAPEEAERILREGAGMALSPEQARAIDSKTEGWGAGLRLAVISLNRKTDPEAFVRGFSGSDRLILEFLTEEVLALQTGETSAFLLRSAVLDRFSPELCDALMAPPSGSAEMLRKIEAANLFLVPLDDEGRWYRYHHLFAETLRARLRAVAPGEEAAILARAAAWHESRDENESAMELLLRAGQRREAARVLERIDYLARGELATLVHLLAAVGEEAVFSRPRLIDLVGWTKVFSGRIAEAEAYMPLAEAKLGNLGPADLVYVSGSFAAMRAFIHLIKGEVPQAVEDARTAELLLEPRDYYPLSIVPFVLGSALRLEGRFEEALVEFERFERIGAALGSIWTISAGRYELATTAFLMGRLRQAASILESALADAEARGAGRFASVAKLRAVYAEILYERNELDRAQEQVDLVLGPTEASGMPGSILELYAAQVRILLAVGEIGKAESCLDKARAIEERGGVLPRIAQSIRDLRRRAAEIRGGGPAEPRGAGDRCFAASKAAEALFLSGGGRDVEALAALEAALEAARPELFVRSFIDLGEGMHLLLAAFLRGARGDGELRSYAARLYADFGEQDAGRAPSGSALVSAREGEVLALLAEGLSNRGIAERLFISESTVKTHLYHLASKLEAPSRLAIVARARALGLA